MPRLPSVLTTLALVLFLSCQTTVPSGTSSGYFPTLDNISPSPQLSLKSSDQEWYKDQNFYHIWVASFADSDANGLGDIKGITAKLDYLKNLGATAIWLSPFCKSGSNVGNLHGYDTIDFNLVDPRLGTNEDMRTLVKEAHDRGMRIIFDLVPNHVSNRHPWFLASKNGDKDKRNWFLWKNEIPEFGWENWGGSSAWRDGGSDSQGNDQYYYAIFWEGMPDLNYRTPGVRKAMADAAIFWLNQGFDGIRMDAVRYLAEDETTGENGVKDVVPETYEFFQKFRAEVLDAYGAQGYSKFMVAENWSSQNNLKDFINKDGKKAFQMTMDFPFGSLAYKTVNLGMDSYTDERGLEAYWKNFIKNDMEKIGGWTGTFLNNHDNYESRPWSEFAGNQSKINLAIVLQYTGLGTPFWYYGNELDMPGVNRGNDTEFRKPMEWDKLPEAQNKTMGTYQTVKTLMDLRQKRPSLRRGDFIPVKTSNEEVAAFLRVLGNEKTLVIFNLGDTKASAEVTLESKVLPFKDLNPKDYRIQFLE